ncbi:MAG: peptide chain release factor N(5)-glutamine methyltransferase, partial [Lachnospiraceae bacterium]|nr:peptide chain release factor N(5)-glutamine methyltransferase [Lachnospiraceae bacterium]
MTYKEIYEQGVAALKDAGVPDAELDARLMLEYVCHTDRNTLYAHGDMPVSEVMCEMFDR